MKYFEYSLYILVFFWVLSSQSKAQTSYQKYDNMTRRTEILLNKSQIKANNELIKYLNTSKNSMSTLTQSKDQARIQRVISAKQDENSRLNQRVVLLLDNPNFR
jgi:hypothetical protein